MTKRKLFTGKIKISKITYLRFFEFMTNRIVKTFLSLILLISAILTYLYVKDSGTQVLIACFIAFVADLLIFDSLHMQEIEERSAKKEKTIVSYYMDLLHDLKHVPDSVFDSINCLLKMSEKYNEYDKTLIHLSKLFKKALYNKNNKFDNSGLILALSKEKSLRFEDEKNEIISKITDNEYDYHNLKTVSEILPLSINVVNSKVFNYPQLYRDTYSELENTINFIIQLTMYYKYKIDKLNESVDLNVKKSKEKAALYEYNQIKEQSKKFNVETRF